MTETYSPRVDASTPLVLWAVWRDVQHVDAYAPQTVNMHACILWCGASEEAARTFARAWLDAYTGSPLRVRRQELQVGPIVGSAWAAERAVFDALHAWSTENPDADQRTRLRVADQATAQLTHVAAWCPACASRQAVGTVLGVELPHGMTRSVSGVGS